MAIFLDMMVLSVIWWRVSLEGFGGSSDGAPKRANVWQFGSLNFLHICAGGVYSVYGFVWEEVRIKPSLMSPVCADVEYSSAWHEIFVCEQSEDEIRDGFGGWEGLEDVAIGRGRWAIGTLEGGGMISGGHRGCVTWY